MFISASTWGNDAILTCAYFWNGLVKNHNLERFLTQEVCFPPKKSARKRNLRTRTHNFASRWNRELDRGAVAIYFFEVLIPDPRKRVWDLVDLVDHQRSGNVGWVDEWRAGVVCFFSNTSRYCEMEIDINMDFIINMSMYFTCTFRFLYVQACRLMHISKYTQTYFIFIMYIYIHVGTYKYDISANVNSCLSGLVWFTIPKLTAKALKIGLLPQKETMVFQHPFSGAFAVLGRVHLAVCFGYRPLELPPRTKNH